MARDTRIGCPGKLLLPTEDECAEECLQFVPSYGRAEATAGAESEPPILHGGATDVQGEVILEGI